MWVVLLLYVLNVFGRLILYFEKERGLTWKDIKPLEFGTVSFMWRASYGPGLRLSKFLRISVNTIHQYSLIWLLQVYSWFTIHVKAGTSIRLVILVNILPAFEWLCWDWDNDWTKGSRTRVMWPQGSPIFSNISSRVYVLLRPGYTRFYQNLWLSLRLEYPQFSLKIGNYTQIAGIWQGKDLVRR